ncbi:unnamed protein product [Schistosoma turkestanicum]|nr:unnamed protein product [Schistosoma turkestanicum]
MTWTSLLASFLDSRVLLQKHNTHGNLNLLNSKDLCMVEFTLSGETIYLVDVLLQMNTIALVPEFGELVAKRIFSLGKSTFKHDANVIRILMLHKWLDLNFSHIEKPTIEQLGKYLDPNSVLDWISLRIRNDIKTGYWKTCTVADKIQILLNSFDLSTLATLLGPSKTSGVGGQSYAKEHSRKKEFGRKFHPSTSPLVGDVCTDIVEEASHFPPYSPTEQENSSSLSVECETDIVSKDKPRPAGRNNRKRKISYHEENVQGDNELSTPSRKTKLNRKCSTIEFTNEVSEIAHNISINQNTQEDVCIETPLYKEPISPMERRQNVSSHRRQSMSKDRIPTVSANRNLCVTRNNRAISEVSVCLDNDSNKPVTKQSETINAVDYTTAVQNKYSLRTRHSSK